MKTLLRFAAMLSYLAHFYFGVLIAGLFIPSFAIAPAADGGHKARALGAALVALFGFALLMYVSAELGARVFGKYDSSRAALPKHHVLLALLFPLPIFVVSLILGSEFTSLLSDLSQSLTCLGFYLPFWLTVLFMFARSRDRDSLNEKVDTSDGRQRPSANSGIPPSRG